MTCILIVQVTGQVRKQVDSIYAQNFAQKNKRRLSEVC